MCKPSCALAVTKLGNPLPNTCKKKKPAAVAGALLFQEANTFLAFCDCRKASSMAKTCPLSSGLSF